MSRFNKQGVRCNWCGKFSNNPNGEYTKPDGISAGYIHQPEWERCADPPEESTNDICEECAAHVCPHCGSAQIVRLTSPWPGQFLWGGRCKKCGKDWIMTQCDRDFKDQECNDAEA